MDLIRAAVELGWQASLRVPGRTRQDGGDNLYVVDASFFPSSGAVNPALTAMANALRVGDHLLERLGASTTNGKHDLRLQEAS